MSYIRRGSSLLLPSLPGQTTPDAVRRRQTPNLKFEEIHSFPMTNQNLNSIRKIVGKIQWSKIANITNSGYCELGSWNYEHCEHDNCLGNELKERPKSRPAGVDH